MNQIKAIMLSVFVIAISQSAFSQSSKREFKSFEYQGRKINYAVQLPSDYEAGKTYPALVGPSDAASSDDQSYYWRGVKDTQGWILLDFPIYSAGKAMIVAFLDHIRSTYKVEGAKFHTICFSANSASIFDLVMSTPDSFHSITGVAGNPGTRDAQKLARLKNVKVQFVVGDRDTYWMNAAKDRHTKLLDAGIDSQIEIIEDGKHVLTELIGEGILGRIDKLRK